MLFVTLFKGKRLAAGSGMARNTPQRRPIHSLGYLSFAKYVRIFRYLLIPLCALCISQYASAEHGQNPELNKVSGIVTSTVDIDAAIPDTQRRAQYPGCNKEVSPRSDDIDSNHSGVLLGKTDADNKIRKFNCLISVNRVGSGREGHKLLLIDTRRPEVFDKFSIPGSLNLPAFTVKTKSFLKDKDIVLFNDGRSLFQLENLCNQLKHKGFEKVSVMEGGLYAWSRAGYPLKGDPLEISKLSNISPSEWISSLQERQWTIIDLDHSLQGLNELFPYSEIIDFQGNNREMITTINRTEPSVSKSRLSGFLVISTQGQDYQTAKRIMQLTDANNVFYLSDGTNALKRFLNSHASQLSRLRKGFREPHRCNG